MCLASFRLPRALLALSLVLLAACGHSEEDGSVTESAYVAHGVKPGTHSAVKGTLNGDKNQVVFAGCYTDSVSGAPIAYAGWNLAGTYKQWRMFDLHSDVSVAAWRKTKIAGVGSCYQIELNAYNTFCSGRGLTCSSSVTPYTID